MSISLSQRRAAYDAICKAMAHAREAMVQLTLVESHTTYSMSSAKPEADAKKAVDAFKAIAAAITLETQKERADREALEFCTKPL